MYSFIYLYLIPLNYRATIKMKRYLFFLLILSLYQIGFADFSAAEKKAIGMHIWHNESGKKYDLLVFWNPKEAFPSLGIGHFIWYPAGHTDIYTQTFPQLIDYFKQKRVKMPSWLIKAAQTGAPWKNYEDFQLHKKDAAVEELRKLLFNTIDLQIDFIIKRLEASWQNIQKNIAPDKQALVTQHFKSLSQIPAGVYALIDYLNFKGEGTNPLERYNGKGWGLLQVLEALPAEILPSQLVAMFARAAQEILENRVKNAPPDKIHEQKWLEGWRKRGMTYPLFKVK